MSSLLINHITRSSLARKSIYHHLSQPWVFKYSKVVTCHRHYYKDPRETYKFWSYDNPGRHRKGDSLWRYLKRNLGFKWLELKEMLTPGKIVHEQSRTIWQYEGPESIDCFLVSSDDVIGGKSGAFATSSKNNKLLFYGKVDTALPRDGETERSGYCYLQLKERYGAFNKQFVMDLRQFNKLTLRVRGDGRAYMITMKPKMYWSDMWDDLYHYVFYTRGGPYWQTISIPFSKFILSAKGRLQDRQAAMMMDKVVWFGIMLADKVDGEFSLEIDSIKVEYDPSHFEEFAYESYGGFKL